jgi:RNA polymerase sigma factor (sigma-70 family)
VAALDDPPGYLYRTALNVFRMRRRRAAVAARRAMRRIAASDAFDAVDQRDALDRALATLSPRRRAALVLTHLLGYSSDDAALMLGVRAVTVRVLASQARAEIRKSMDWAND